MEDRIVEKDFGDLAVNMGPQHPSTHGVFRLKLYLQGEKINKIESFLGYLHRGVEKLSEKLNYDQLPPVLERDDYLSPTSNSLGFVNAVEKIDVGNVETLENNNDDHTYFSFPKKEDVAIFLKRKKKFF